MSSHETETIRETVHTHYAEIARATLAGTEEATERGCYASTSGCGAVALDATTLATSIGYAATDLSTLPEGANMDLWPRRSCATMPATASRF